MKFTESEFHYYAKAVVKVLRSGRYVESSHNKGYTPWITSGDPADRFHLNIVEVGGRAATALSKKGSK